VRRGPAKGVVCLGGTQNNSSRKFSSVEIHSAKELSKLLRGAERRFERMESFIINGAFAGRRRPEIAEPGLNAVTTFFSANLLVQRALLSV
jgi:hypothetical protein